MKKHKNGFTLAEVLITLVIIGIIAAMTIPTLMNKTNEQETVVAVKKAYSVLSQAYQRLVADYGEINPSYFGSTYAEATKNFGDALVKYLNVQKVCGQSKDDDCWSTQNGGVYKYYDGSDWYNVNANDNNHYLVRLNDGSSLLINYYFTYVESGTSDALKYVFAVVNIDINGDKGPNIVGKDVFAFYFSKYGMLPLGLSDDTIYPLSSCRSNGISCTAWVVTKGNMDYLRKEVSW